ncbi:MAG: hypothetical protein NWS56_07480 [Haliea sp.]|nr:hypothetical protein [Haliea sp.]
MGDFGYPQSYGMAASRVAWVWPCVAVLICLALAGWIYWTGQLGDYILDDRSSLLRLQSLSEHPEWLWDYVLGDRSGLLGRPISMLTFALEHAFIDGTASTLKRHSLLLHLIIGAVVFWFSYLVCITQRYRYPAFLGLLAMALWLLAPQQTSTVLYAVQRMAMLSAFFVLLALVCYMKARLCWGRSDASWAWGAGAAICVVLAPFAKENGLLALPLIISLEATLLRGRLVTGGVHRYLQRCSQLAMLLGVFAVLAYFSLNFDAIEAGYNGRAFSLHERLLTQPVILWDYIGQFYWPDLSRMGVYHDDVTVYSSLLQPAVPLVAIVTWLLLFSLAGIGVVLGVSALFPLLSMLFFYVVAHSMESSFFALELYFEHRNYLPSVALALLPALCVGELGRRWPELVSPLLAWLFLAVFVLALKTVTQVQIWSSPTLLALHHLNGHPQSVRANNDMATRMAELGAFDAALEYSQAGFTASQAQKAARTERDGDFRIRNVALACMAGAPVPVKELELFARVSPERPAADTNTFEVLAGLQREMRCPDFEWGVVAERFHEVYLADPSADRASVGVFTALSVMMNSLNRIEDASEYAKLGLLQNQDNVQLLLMRVHFATLLNEDAVVRDLLVHLGELESQSLLTINDSKNLSLYR